MGAGRYTAQRANPYQTTNRNAEGFAADASSAKLELEDPNAPDWRGRKKAHAVNFTMQRMMNDTTTAMVTGQPQRSGTLFTTVTSAG